MKLLGSHSIYANLAEYDIKNRTYIILSGDNSNNRSKTQGSYELLNNFFVAIFTKKNNIYLAIDDKLIKVNDGLRVDFTKDKHRRILKIVPENHGEIILDYSIDESIQIENDPTPFIDDEDFDYGLLIYNILRTPERQKVLLGLDN